MDAEPPLDYLLDESGPGAAGGGAGREELLAIMARSRSQRHRLAALGMAATLAVGGAGGWLVAGGASSSSSVGPSLAAGVTTTTVVPPVPANGPCIAPGGGPCGGAAAAASAGAPVSGAGGAVGVATVAPGGKLTKVFVRTTADGVTIRAYRTQAEPSPAACPIPVVPGLVAEVSTSEITAQSVVGISPASEHLIGFTSAIVGVAEGAPVWVVTAQVDGSVAQVRAAFADGKTDQMSPVGGWAVLAHVAPTGTTYTPPTGSIQVMDKAGKVLDSQPFPAPPTIKPLPPVPAGGGGVASSSGGGVASASGSSNAVAVATTAPPKTVVPGSPPQTAVRPPCMVVPPVPAPLTTTAPTTKSDG